MNDNTGTQALWPQMIRALAAIDEALGLPDDGCNSTAQTLDAIRQLRANLAASQARSVRMVELMRKLREPDWHIESIREFQRELAALENAAMSDDSALREMIEAEREACASILDDNAQNAADDSTVRLVLATNALMIRARKE